MNIIKLWIARDKDNTLNLFYERPIKSGEYFIVPGSNYLSINRNTFPEVTFENSPQLVSTKLIK